MNIVKCFLIFVFLTGLCFSKDVKSIKIGDKAPPIKVKEWITPTLTDIKHFQGKTIIVYFWATWCGACMEGVPTLKRINKNYDIEILALSQDKSSRVVYDFVKREKIKYHVLMDYGSVDKYMVRAYPTIFIIDENNKIVWYGHNFDSIFWDKIKHKEIKK